VERNRLEHEEFQRSIDNIAKAVNADAEELIKFMGVTIRDL